MGAALCDEAPNLEIVCTHGNGKSESKQECPGVNCGGAGKRKDVCRNCAYLSEVHKGKLVCRDCHEYEKKNREQRE